MTCRFVLCSVVFVMSACAGVSSDLQTLPPEPPEVFLLMGQSNMSGRGHLEDLPDGRLAPTPNIQAYGNDGMLRMAAAPVDSALNQIDQVSADRSAGVDPGLAFAHEILREHPFRNIILVPCAKGGSAISEWARSLSRDTLYGSCLARAIEASEYGAVSGILWYQGESDTDRFEDAAAWSDRFRTIVADLRTDLADNDLPFVMISIGDRPEKGRFAERFPAWGALQTAQDAFQADTVIVVPAAGLGRNDDQLHLSTDGLLELGQRIADAWLQEQ
nr:sialate O-acetylesterase [uncultured Hyphomonas sp.]